MQKGSANNRVASWRFGAIAVAMLSSLALLAAGCGDDSSSTKEEAFEALKEAAANLPTTPQSNGTTADGAAPESGGAATAAAGNPAIEEFGSEAEGGERDEIVAAFDAYNSALGSEDYDAVCAALAEPVRTLLERISEVKKEDQDCAAIIAGLPEAAKKAISARSGGKVVEVRVEGDRAYVIFKAPGAKRYQLAMIREDGEWSAGLVTASVLVPSS